MNEFDFLAGVWCWQKFMKDVMEQLACNASDEYKKRNVTFDFTPEEVRRNSRYFMRCFEAHISPYVALTQFGDFIGRK